MGCSDWLDLKPESALVLEDYWKTESQASSVVAGCYKALTNDACMSLIILWGEGRSDNVEAFDTDDESLIKMTKFNLTPTNGYTTWGPFYTVINYCNTFLYYAPGVLKTDPNFTQAKLQSMQAEVLTIRALAYFYLVRSFKYIPWVETPSLNDQQDYNVAQSAESVVLANIIRDLKTALLYAPDVYSTTQYTKGRVTKNAVRALLADVYLWDQQYANCVEMCNNVLSDKALALVKAETMLKEVFYTGNSTESIFELQFGEASDGKQFNNVVAGYYGCQSDYLSKLCFSDFYITSAKNPFLLDVKYTISKVSDIQDIRFKDFIYSTLFANKYLIFKYSGYNRYQLTNGNSNYIYRPNSANWIVYRLSDVMLMKAEALVQLNRSSEDLNEALRMVNTTYLRANENADSLKMSDYSTQNALSELVLRERQRELIFEGKRWFDLMRLARRVGKPAPLIDYISAKYSDLGGLVTSNSSMDALYLPINQGELKSNNKLVQNSYYNSVNATSSTVKTE
jgi:hypothetical protein